MLNVTLTNSTQSPIPLTSGPEPGYKFFQFTVTQAGAELHRTVLQRRLRGEPNMDDPTVADPGTSVSFQFPAGQSFTVSVDLARLYDSTMPGTYTVIADHWDEERNTRVYAPPIQITVGS